MLSFCVAIVLALTFQKVKQLAAVLGQQVIVLDLHFLIKPLLVLG